MLLMAVSLGCSKLSERLRQLDRGDSAEILNSNSTDSNSSGLNISSDDGSEENITAKANLYITTCSNKYTNSVLNSYRRYTSWISDRKTGPTGKERNVYGLYRISGDGSDCEKAVGEAAAMRPSMPDVEQAATNYVEALKDTITKVNSLYSYYDQNDYKDDNFQKGKAEHAALMEVFEKFDSVSMDFSTEVDKLEDEVAKRDLERFRNDPDKKLNFAVTDMNIRAKKALAYVNRTKYEDLSTETMQTNIDELEEALESVKNSQGDKPMLISSYLSSAENFIKELKELMRRVRDKTPYTDMERRWLGTAFGWMVKGSQDKVVHEYNSFIRSRGFLRL